MIYQPFVCHRNCWVKVSELSLRRGWGLSVPSIVQIRQRWFVVWKWRFSRCTRW